MSTIHLIGLPHTGFDADNFSTCAFTAKAVRTVRMWRSKGHDVLVYWGGDLGDVSLMSVDEQRHHFGEYSHDSLPVIEWGLDIEYWRLFNDRSITEIRQRISAGDIIAFVGGGIHQPVVDAFKDLFTVIEPGVGYEGLARDTFACFESLAWMHNRYGAYGIGNGRAFDEVIPNVVIEDEWNTPEPSEGYALFVGRLISRKGPHVAAQIADRAGLPLVLAGGGVAHKEPGKIVATDGTVIEGNVTHVGAVTGQARRDLFSKAEVLICPTLYIGPWEGVHAEALMSGVGVAASAWGAMTETLPRDLTFRSMSQAVRAVEIARETRGEVWRRHASATFGWDRCSDLYDKWLDRLHSLRDGRGGWYH